LAAVVSRSGKGGLKPAPPAVRHQRLRSVCHNPRPYVAAVIFFAP
jgi:hypothetical protein